MALQELLGTFGVDAFFAGYFPERHLTVHGSLDRLPSFLSSGLLTQPCDLARAYRGPVYVTNRNLGRFQVHGIDARDCFEGLGLSVGFTEVEELLPGAADWLRVLETELGMPRGSATMAAFVNGPDSGLSVHCDPQEQIAIHVRGPKAFRVAPHPARFPRMQHVPGRATPPEWLGQSPSGLLDVKTLPASAEHIELAPGSVLYTPRGLYHETLSGDDLAVTAVIAFRNPTPADLLAKYLENVLMQSEDWRRPLYGAWSADAPTREAALARMAGLLERAAAEVAGLSLPHLLAAAETPATDGALLADDTRLQRDPSTAVVLRADGDERIRVEVGLELGAGATTSLSLPVPLAPMLEWVAHGRAPFTVAEACARFDEWDESAVAATLAAFLRTKALVALPFQAARA
jgi:hypothetical protein